MVVVVVVVVVVVAAAVTASWHYYDSAVSSCHKEASSPSLLSALFPPLNTYSMQY